MDQYTAENGEKGKNMVKVKQVSLISRTIKDNGCLTRNTEEEFKQFLIKVFRKGFSCIIFSMMTLKNKLYNWMLRKIKSEAYFYKKSKKIIKNYN